MQNRRATGASASLYVGSLMESARPGRAGLNASRLSADALAGARSKAARSRLRLASRGATVRARRAHAGVRRRAAAGRFHVETTRTPARRCRAKPRPRPGRAG